MATRHAPVALALQTVLTPPASPNPDHLDQESCISPKITYLALRPSRPQEFQQALDLQRDGDGKPVEYGRGVWSVVYMARPSWTSPAAGLTPPPSPGASSRVFAVKAPLRRDAHAVLQAEALILTRINWTSGWEHYVVPFHGFITTSSTIVMSAIPLQLSTYVEDRAAIARQNFSTRTMFDPVLGLSQWLEVARTLIAGLAWLHNKAHVIHGDIKPHNILLRPRPIQDGSDLTLAYDPLYTDFSSAHDLLPPTSSASDSPRTSLSALSPPFTAPELLSVSVLKSPDLVATSPCDVFSLATTLLAAATGDLLLYPGTSSMQRLAMSCDGHRVLDYVQFGPNGSRVPRKGIIENILKQAITKEPSERILPGEWLKLVES
jgi:serine/threonine protein kinase